MSIFATVATICTLAFCNDYVIDTAPIQQDGITNTNQASDTFLNLWGDEKMLNAWLDKYKIGETVFEIVSVDFDTVKIKDKEIP